MAAMSGPRYAVYYAPDPDSPLDALGKAWLGRDMEGKKTELLNSVPNFDPDRISELTRSPKQYGFHGTLKPPFELPPTATLQSLLRTAQIFAQELSPVEIPPLELAVIGKFIALSPVSQSVELEKLAAACVRAFEGFREPLTDDQIQGYRANKLTVHQEQMLEHWGYPYVMEEFRFHMSLTDRIDNENERESLMKALETLAQPVLGKSISVRHICLFKQENRDADMVAIERIPFGRQ